MAKLTFYYSAMNAGKTTTLLQSSYNYQERGLQTVLFIPDFDDRDGVGKVASRIGLEADGIAFSSTFNLYTYIKSEISKPAHNIQCVMVDEAQFLTKDQVLQLSDIVDFLDIPVLCYGLRTDFLGEPFVGSKYLLATAERLEEIKTICHCGRKATMTLRLDENGDPQKAGAQIEIGGNDRYISMCRKHHKEATTGALASDDYQFMKVAA